MPSFPSFEHLANAQSTWQAIDRLVDEVAAQAREDIRPAAFYGVLLENLLPALAADSAAVWFEQEGRLVRLYTSASSESQPPSDSVEYVQQAFNSGRPIVLATAPADEGCDGTLFLSPMLVDDEVIGVLEVLRAPGVTGEVQRSYSELLSTFAEVATDFHCRQQLRRLLHSEGKAEQLGEFIRSIHRRVDLSDTCYAIANDGRRLAGCDRISVLIQHRGQLRVQAISGVDLFDPRCEEVRQLQRLAHATGRTAEPLWFDGDASDQPPEIERLIQAYADVAGTRAVAILPLMDTQPDGDSAPRLLGALAFERFEGGPFEHPERDTLAAVACHAVYPVRNALEFRSLPLLWLSRLLRGLLRGRQWSRSLMLLALTAALITSSLIVRTDLAIHCRGELQPTGRRDIFAPSDGSIELRVDYGARVAQGDVLLELHNPDLDYEFTRVLGEIQTTEAQLRAVQASSATASRSDQDPQELHQLGADEERLKEVLRGLQQQREVLERQRQALQIRSPIEGRVLTWNVQELLQSRPVKHGQKLMAVVDPDGPWVLEVNVADHDIGHVLAARRDKQLLDVDFFLATNPAVVHQGRVQSVALASETSELHGTSVRVTVAVDAGGLAQPRPGAGVVAKIHCGRRSVAYVWLRDVIDVIRTKVLF